MADTMDIKFLNTCRRNLDVFSADTRYNSSNPDLALVNLTARLDAGYPIANDISVKFAAQQIRVNNRQAIYEKIDAFAKKSRRYLRSCGATEREIEDGNRYVNDLLGYTKAKPKNIANPDAPAGEGEETHAKAQLSYAALYANLMAYREFLRNVTAYQPNEDEIKISTLDALIEECGTANEDVSAGFAPLSAAWNLRDENLYTDEDSIINLFRKAKEYYKSLYEPKDPQYRAITRSDMTLRDYSRK